VPARIDFLAFRVNSGFSGSVASEALLLQLARHWHI